MLALPNLIVWDNLIGLLIWKLSLSCIWLWVQLRLDGIKTFRELRTLANNIGCDLIIVMTRGLIPRPLMSCRSTPFMYQDILLLPQCWRYPCLIQFWVGHFEMVYPIWVANRSGIGRRSRGISQFVLSVYTRIVLGCRLPPLVVKFLFNYVGFFDTK